MSTIASTPTNSYVPPKNAERFSHWRTKPWILLSPDLAEILAQNASLCAISLKLTLLFPRILAIDFTPGILRRTTLE